RKGGYCKMYNKNKKMILKNLCADIQEKERIARIMNSTNSLYDDFKNQIPFQSQELFNEEERQIVCHMCLRLGDQLESNKGILFVYVSTASFA
ncbi:hypothetical protein, partial [Lysinibacillus capsici]